MLLSGSVNLNIFLLLDFQTLTQYLASAVILLSYNPYEIN